MSHLFFLVMALSEEQVPLITSPEDQVSALEAQIQNLSKHGLK